MERGCYIESFAPQRRRSLRHSTRTRFPWALAVLLLAGCAASKKTVVPPAAARASLVATPEQLLEQYNDAARWVKSLNASVELNPVAGSAYTGVIEDYRDVRGFILAQRPGSIRVLGQAPVINKNIFDMVSDGETFRIFIPSKNKFLVGPASLERPAKKPIENLRPQHLLDAMFWQPLQTHHTILFEEFESEQARYYILTELRQTGRAEIVRKVWFDRSDLRLSRIQIFGSNGRLQADVFYSDWPASSGPPPAYPRHIRMVRPHDDYRLEIRITKITLNEEIPADRFHLAQPAGAELVRLDENPPEARP
jgi:outer membrane lipoprotein-sorting protein